MAERKEKPISRNKKNYRPTKSGAGMTRAGVAAYRRANPGSKLKTAVTGKVKPGSKAANRRKSYCARSLGQLKRSSAKTRNDPNSANIFLDNSVGIGEHPQHIEEVNKQVEKIANAKEKLDVLDEFEPERGETL
jgi:hypothetical protein